jgi:hypothetical protein
VLGGGGLVVFVDDGGAKVRVMRDRRTKSDLLAAFPVRRAVFSVSLPPPSPPFCGPCFLSTTGGDSLLSIPSMHPDCIQDVDEVIVEEVWARTRLFAAASSILTSLRNSGEQAHELYSHTLDEHEHADI